MKKYLKQKKKNEAKNENSRKIRSRRRVEISWKFSDEKNLLKVVKISIFKKYQKNVLTTFEIINYFPFFLCWLLSVARG